MNARGTRGLASAASEAQDRDGARRRRRASRRALGERLHQVDAPARRIHLGPRQHVGRARLQAEPAMHAVEQQFVFDHVAHRRRRRAGATGSRVSRRSPSKSPNEASGIEDSGRIERGLEPAHQLERAGRRVVEKFQMPIATPARPRARRRWPRAACAMRAPSRERLARLHRVKLAADEDLRDAASRVRTKLRAAGLRRIARSSAGATASCAAIAAGANSRSRSRS